MLTSLEEWLRNEDFASTSIDRTYRRPKPGTMGDPLTILTVVLGSKAVVELIRSIQIWVKTRPTNKFRLRLKTNQGELDLEVSSTTSEESVLREAIATLAPKD